MLTDPAMKACPSNRVTILMAMYNGAPWLATQLESIYAQSHRNWRLIVSDDGSKDGSPDQLLAWTAQHTDAWIELRQGPSRGAASNFLSMLSALNGEREGFVALADQDDRWLPGKLHRALQTLNTVPARRPGLYCGPTIICDESLRPLRRSRIPQREAAFANAIVQNIAGGNTMVLNPAAAKLVKGAAQEADKIVIHDWWIYQIVTGAGGVVLFDPEPQVYYRQHGHNQIGANDRIRDQARRARKILGGQARDWMDINLAALQRSRHRLTHENQVLLEALTRARTLPSWQRIGALRELGLYCQTRRGDLGLWISAALNRI